METKELVVRKQTLTEADLKALADLFKEHSCRFDNITKEDMDFIKDLLSMYKETRSEVIKWVVKGAIWGSIILIGIFIYFKVGKH